MNFYIEPLPGGEFGLFHSGRLVAVFESFGAAKLTQLQAAIQEITK